LSYAEWAGLWARGGGAYGAESPGCGATDIRELARLSAELAGLPAGGSWVSHAARVLASQPRFAGLAS
jgi:hypothetical protein